MPEQRAELDTIDDADTWGDLYDRYARKDKILVSVVPAASEAAAWALVKPHFPDYEKRSINPTIETTVSNADRFTEFAIIN